MAKRKLDEIRIGGGKPAKKSRRKKRRIDARERAELLKEFGHYAEMLSREERAEWERLLKIDKTAKERALGQCIAGCRKAG